MQEHINKPGYIITIFDSLDRIEKKLEEVLSKENKFAQEKADCTRNPDPKNCPRCALELGLKE